MKIYFRLIVLIFSMLVCCRLCSADDITLISYYPAPLGVYNNLYSKIIYDVDNINYYIDPAGLSVFDIVNIKGDEVLKKNNSSIKIVRPDDNIFYMELKYNISKSTYDFTLSRQGVISFNPRNGTGTVFVPEGEIDVIPVDSTRIHSFKIKHNGTNASMETTRGILAFSMIDQDNSDVVQINDGVYLPDTVNNMPIDSNNDVLDYKLFAREQIAGLPVIYGRCTSDIKEDAGIFGTNIHAEGGVGIIGHGSNGSVGVLGFTGSAPDSTQPYFIQGTGVFGFSSSGSRPGIVALSKAANNGCSALYAYVYHQGAALYAGGGSRAATIRGDFVPNKTNWEVGSHNVPGALWPAYAYSCLGCSAGFMGGRDNYWNNTYINSIHADFGDISEGFKIIEKAEPGDVLIIKRNSVASLCNKEEDNRILGVISTEPGIAIRKKKAGEKDVALLGTVPVKADATKYPIEPGDLLTTSKTPGHAMKCVNPKTGIILGKALEGLKNGKSKIKVFVNLM